MKITYCILGTFNSGGMERVLTNKANYLVNKGYEVNVVTTDQKGRKPFYALDPRIKTYDLGINYTDDLNRGILKRGAIYLKKQHLHQKKLAELLHTLKSDITISMFDNDASFITKINDGSKKVLEIHFSRFKRLQYGRSGLLGFIDKFRNKQDLRTVARFAKFVVLTHEDKGYWGDLPNIQVIPNANSFKRMGRALLENKRVIAIGRLDYQKRFEDLIEAWIKVKETAPEWVLDIFGKGPLKTTLEEQIAQLNLTDVVRINEPVNNIQEEYLGSAMLALTSRYEGLPMALLEAQSCGLPMVAYACKCGPKDIIKNGENGFLVPEGDIGRIADNLLTLIADPELRSEMGGNAYLSSARYDEEAIMEQWESMFSDITKI